MKKTMIYLTEEQALLLKRKSQETGNSTASLIREAIDKYITSQKKEKDYFSFVGIAEGPKGEAISENVEEALKQIIK
ncbi:MAG: ribbon-helix-helix domain-containing protein [Actinobacteria bacterium]|nr:ribbon-helix-helix domain-containing protein [Actinomycetota bacterium]